MKNINNIINNVLQEATVNRNQILHAIKSKQLLTVEKAIINGEGDGAIIQEVYPIDIDGDDIVTGTTKDGDEIQFSLDDITSNITEDVNMSSTTSPDALKKVNDAEGGKGIPMASEKIANMSTTDVSKVLQTADTADVDINLNEEEEEPTGEANLAQKDNIFNFLGWCNAAGVDYGAQKKKGDILNYSLFIGEVPTEAFVYPNGDIKIGGHLAKDEDMFNRIISFYKDNQGV